MQLFEYRCYTSLYLKHSARVLSLHEYGRQESLLLQRLRGHKFFL